MSLKDKLTARRDAHVADRADALLQIEEYQRRIANLEALRHTQHGAIQACEHALKLIAEEEAAQQLEDANVTQLLEEAHEVKDRLDQAIAAAETEGMTGGTMIEFPGVSNTGNDTKQQTGDDLQKAQAS